MCTKGVRDQVFIETLIDPQLMLDQPAINTRSTSRSTVSQETTNFRRHTIEC